jgi:hypothetical protein
MTRRVNHPVLGRVRPLSPETASILTDTAHLSQPRLRRVPLTPLCLGYTFRVAAMFVLFHKRVCGPLANTRFHHRPEKTSNPPAKIEAAYHEADAAIQKLIDLLAA